ncbi:amidohydrolase [Alkalicoccobacillus murimartini]|uniref:Cytosine/adenosine deaminase-related metal-dependent hydrolase n=1 Tax=Alkalicoccobacillus murimartini TaxID=171685 RepID=A0ABT9YMG6_9BACI|nr:amidohydrolase [Alkalicoccobacillus murimartini]MDQ0209080.1 cytosine/adenosine deaminase-related metal-dependent hydrolase [Alkalicoccobacillus murimartini]
MNTSTFWIFNVSLETGFIYQGDEVVGTETKHYFLQIESGSIVTIQEEQPEENVPYIDAKGLLLMPSFRDMHIHLDKTFYGGPWKAPSSAPGGIFTRLQEEERLLPELRPYTKDRAEKLIDLLTQSGTTTIRTHCNVGSIEGLHQLEATVEARETYKDKADIEIVAFPQQGLIRGQARSYVQEALKNGASFVGGVDPATIDTDIEHSLQTMMELAVQADAGIDLHLHDSGHLGLFTMKRLAALTEEAKMQGRVTISHALALADSREGELTEMAQILHEQKIDITSTVSLGKTIPIPFLHKQGVRVSLGADSITDHWSPFGTGDSLDKATVYAERFGKKDEVSLHQALAFITGHITPLDQEGKRVWPTLGSPADFVLVDATCSAQAVARRAERRAVFYKGKMIVNKL